MEIKDYYTKEGCLIGRYPELEKLLQEEGIYGNFIKNERINMVGSYTLCNGSRWYSFPKYHQVDLEAGPSKEDMDDLRVIMKIIEKLRSEGHNLFEGDKLFESYEKKEQMKRVNLTELSKLIVKDYLQNGIYKRIKQCFTKCGVGKVSWAKTIGKISPIIDNSDVVYVELFNKRRYENYDNLISEIHALVVNRSIDIYERMIDNVRFTRPVIDKEFISTDLSIYVKILREELSMVFTDRDINLVKALIAWCDKTENYKYVGCTNCFENVWEWVNDAVFGNIKRKESERPVYTIDTKRNSTEELFTGSGEGRPDTIFFTKKDDEFFLYLYDAKYYVPTFDTRGRKVYNYPANSDIVKQIAYMEGMVSGLESIKDFLHTQNTFLLPEIADKEMDKIDLAKEGELFSKIGYTTRANYNSVVKHLLQGVEINIETTTTIREEEKVILYMVYCDRLYERYLKGEKYRPI